MRRAGAEAMYKVADEFRERCLVAGKSLLWPDDTAWSPDTITVLWNAFIGHPDTSDLSFLEKWRSQLAGCPIDAHKVAADVFILYQLPIWPGAMGPAKKMANLETVLGWKLGDHAANLGFIAEAFKVGIMTPGQFYLIGGRPWQIAFFLEFARRLIQEGVDPQDRVRCQRLADDVCSDRTSLGIGNITSGRHVLLHLLFPDFYESIASDEWKQKIVTRFKELAGGTSDVDEALWQIRSELTKQYGDGFEFFDPAVKAQWYSGPNPPPADPPPPADDPVLGTLIDATNLTPLELAEIESLLREKRQVILEGPPGSGKTFVAEKFARYFTDNPLEGDHDERLEIVQFHQSYGYEDFVQGIRPETNEANGQLEYHVRPGIFMRLCERARRNPVPHVIIIDEINRGNISRVFGELLLLLEYREMSARLPFSSDNERQFTIPSNVYIIGTMNTTDRTAPGLMETRIIESRPRRGWV